VQVDAGSHRVRFRYAASQLSPRIPSEQVSRCFGYQSI
jgi:hypothetical protein